MSFNITSPKNVTIGHSLQRVVLKAPPRTPLALFSQVLGFGLNVILTSLVIWGVFILVGNDWVSHDMGYWDSLGLTVIVRSLFRPREWLNFAEAADRE